MSNFYRRVYLLTMVLLFGGLATSAMAQNNSMLPPNTRVERTFQPGTGTPVGEVIRFEGLAYVIHVNSDSAYSVETGMRLFQNDTLITESDSRIHFQLADASEITLAPQTRLTIDRSIFNPDQKERSVYMRMNMGKARFWIKKLIDFRQSSVKVKTHTAIAGVRGSRYIIEEFTDRTVITTREKTVLEIICLANPEKEPIILNSFQQVVIPEGKCPREADIETDLPQKLLEELDRPFEFKKSSAKPETVSRPRSYDDEPVVLPQKLLVIPQEPGSSDGLDDGPHQEVERSRHEDVVRQRAGDRPLPPFPDPPE